MPRLRPLYPAIRLAVGCLVLAIVLRTWLVMGLIEPVTVSGSSMVPTLRGSSVSARCRECQHRFDVGSEFAATTESAVCPRCMSSEVPLDSLELNRGDRLWVDRTTWRRRNPERWELVVARNPHDAAELCIKRVVGLPGEQVSLREGNLVIDGAVFLKSRADQLAFRQPIHTAGEHNRRWHAEENTTWRFDSKGWLHAAESGAAVDWLRYHHPLEQAITDDVAYNAGLTRRLNLISDFLLSTNLSVRGTGTLHLSIDDGTATAELILHLPGGKLTVMESGNRSLIATLADDDLKKLTTGPVQIEFTNFDRQLLLVIDGQVALRRPWPQMKPTGTSQPFAIGAQGVEVSVEGLTLYRDIYYSDQAVGTPPARQSCWQLGPDEYFLLGDNPPVSADSRLWGPVSARLLLGKPLFLDR